jgi:CO dehydrogenase maturation factor
MPVRLLPARVRRSRLVSRERGGSMKVAVAGKGGSGKTTISATLSRLLARRGHPVMAVDGDPNPNLAVALGMSREIRNKMVRVPKDVMETKEEGGARRLVMARPIEEVTAEYAMPAPDGVNLMVMTGVDHAGAG